ncbi:MAG: glycosyltransferase family 9 protein, partial [Candidatus Omnitrophota bacterium]
EKFDVTLDLSLSSQYGFFLFCTGIPKRIGYDYRGRGRFLTHKIRLIGYSGKHMVEYYKDLLSYFGLKPADEIPKISLPAKDIDWSLEFLRQNGISEKDVLIAIAPGGGASWGKDAIYKHWMADGFANVADALAEAHNAKIILLGDSSDCGICESVLNIMKHKPVLACGKTGLLKFAALLKRCKVLVCNDGGPLHVAAAVGTKTASVFGPVDERVYGPYPKDANHVVIKNTINCRPCYKNFRFRQCKTIECLRSVEPRQVIEAVNRLMGK